MDRYRDCIYCEVPTRSIVFVPAFVVIVSVHVSVVGVVWPLYVTMIGNASHWFSVTVGGTGGAATAKCAQPEPAPFVCVIAVMFSGAVPLFTRLMFCGDDAVTEVPGNGGAGAEAGVIDAVNGANAFGFTKRIGVVGGFTVRPFGEVSVQPVTALVNTTSNCEVCGAVPPAVQLCVCSGRFGGIVTVYVVMPFASGPEVPVMVTAMPPMVIRGKSPGATLRTRIVVVPPRFAGLPTLTISGLGTR